MFQCWATLGPTSIHRWSMSFIGVIMYMSVVHLPSTLHYWSEGTYIEKVASLLTCNKFEEIKRLPLMAHLHGIGILPLGTIQLNRAKDIDLPSKKELLKYERGHCIEKSTEINGVQISVTTWVDNKV
ncbi:hypothetical protein SFRURICE_001249, partial [Spodoptera frugiperda]